MSRGGACAKLGLLALLTSQNAGTTIVIKLAQARGSNPDSVVLMLLAEVVKLAASLLLFAACEAGGRWREQLTPLRFAYRCAKLLPIAGLFALQNQLVLLGATNLDPPVFQALSQIKILTAGVFSFLLLGKRLSRVQWAALLILACGAALVQMDTPGEHAKVPGLTGVDRAKGFNAVVAGCTLSGLAGCYTELMLKAGALPMWLQSAVVALASAVMLSSTLVAQRGAAGWVDLGELAPARLLTGFVDMTWAVVLMMSIGGLIVVPVLRYADNVLKGMSMVVALLLSTALSVALFGTEVGPVFAVSAVVICSSVFIYQSAPRAAAAAAASARLAAEGGSPCTELPLRTA